jgi:hypothetical protein
VPLALSGVLASDIVTGFDLGPRATAGLRPPFANLHGGNPAGLPSYGTFAARGRSDGHFNSLEKTTDAPERVLDFYEQSIDRTIWTIPTRGRISLAFVLRADPRVRGGVVTSLGAAGTTISLVVDDMQLPAGFPIDFPVVGHHASVLVPGEVTNGLSHLRWDVGVDDRGFMDSFAQILEDAHWQVVIKSPASRPLSLTCRSRISPEITCRVVVSIEADPRMHGQFRSVADVWVGTGAADSS